MSLIDFINHGILPFTGREGITARIAEAVGRIAEARGLHAMLMTGEAGAGKTRLIEEAIRRAEESGVAVIHAKLYPESPTAIAPMLSNAIWRYTMAHPTINVSADDTLPSVASALRRLARLRRLLLVLEDIHLIAGEGVAQLALLLQGLSAQNSTYGGIKLIPFLTYGWVNNSIEKDVMTFAKKVKREDGQTQAMVYSTGRVVVATR